MSGCENPDYQMRKSNSCLFGWGRWEILLVASFYFGWREVQLETHFLDFL